MFQNVQFNRIWIQVASPPIKNKGDNYPDIRGEYAIEAADEAIEAADRVIENLDKLLDKALSWLQKYLNIAAYF